MSEFNADDLMGFRIRAVDSLHILLGSSHVQFTYCIALSLDANLFFSREFELFVYLFLANALVYRANQARSYLNPFETVSGLEIAMWYFGSFFASLGIVLGVTGAKAVMSGGASLVTDALKMEEYENFMRMLLIMHFILVFVFFNLSGGMQ